LGLKPPVCSDSQSSVLPVPPSEAGMAGPAWQCLERETCAWMRQKFLFPLLAALGETKADKADQVVEE
jgi:hypothetical protein